MAIAIPIIINANVIIIKGVIIEGSMLGLDNLLIVAGWCKVFHQSTENLTIGRFTEPTRINIATTFSLTILFSKDKHSSVVYAAPDAVLHSDCGYHFRTANIEFFFINQQQFSNFRKSFYNSQSLWDLNSQLSH